MWDSDQSKVSDQPTSQDLLKDWLAAAASLEVVKRAELAARNACLAAWFKDQTTGTKNIELANGWKLKAEFKDNYTLDRDDTKVDTAILKIEKIGPNGRFIAERLINWKPNLSVAEYKKLSVEHRAVMQTVVTIKPGQPSLELVAPKDKA